MKPRKLDISFRTSELLDGFRDKLRSQGVDDWNLEKFRDTIRNAAANQESFESVIAELRQTIQKLDHLDHALQSLLEQVEKFELREVRFGSAWWKKRRLEIQEALEKNSTDGFIFWVQTVAEAVISWDFSVREELTDKQVGLTAEHRQLTAQWSYAIKCLEEEQYTEPKVEEVLTDLIMLTRPQRSSPLLDAATRAVLLVIRGRIRLYDLKQNESALRDFEESRQLTPDDELPIIAIGEHYRMQGLNSDAAGYFQRAIQLTPNCTQAYLGLGLCAEDDNNAAEADDFFNKAAATVLEEANPLQHFQRLRAPRTGRAYLKLAEQLQHRDSEAALAAADKAIEFEIRLGGQYPKRFPYRVKAQILLDLGRKLEASESFLEAGKRFAWEGESAAALEALEQAFTLNPGNREIAWQLADGRYVVAYSLEGDEKRKLVDSAITLWDKTIAQGLPEQGNAWVYLTRGLLSEQRSMLVPGNEWPTRVELFGHAIAFVERSILMDDKRDLAWALLARYYRELNLNENELAAGAHPFQQAGDEKLNAAVLEERLITLGNRNQADMAEAMMTGDLDPNKNAWAKSVLGFARLTSGRYEEAIALLKDLPPGTAWVTETRALARDMVGDLAGGDSDWQELIKSSDSPDMAREFGYAACKLGRCEEAINKLSTLIANPIRRADAERMLVLCHLSLKQYDVATETFERAAPKSAAADLRRWVDLDLLSPRIRRNVPEQILHRFYEAAELLVKQPPPSLDIEIRNAIQTFASDGKMSWVRVGLEASLARILQSNGDSEQAASIYRSLENLTPFDGSNLSPFPEAGLGLAKASSKTQGAAGS